MMLNSRAPELHQLDTLEIMSYLPNLQGLKAVELGAGIGRFTGHLAQRAKHVLAVDFVAKFIEKNREVNGVYRNIDYVVDDVMNINLEPNSVGFVFTNWLFMYLDDEASTRLLHGMLTWLPSDGYVFVRESCLYGSGDLSFNEDTTFYREAQQFEALFRSVNISGDDRTSVYHLRIVMSKSLDSYCKVMKNENQILWLLQKVKRETTPRLQ
ncbi:phosphoethanolamine N-methyltransferase-like isoform X2 [Mizuhopecten yessoensis]|nr:phosphoethanolamine N-methyltransferase-like isoform X2 [Mizuhopecten yessoensis]